MYDCTHTKYNILAASQDAASLHGSCKGVLSYTTHTSNPRYLRLGMYKIVQLSTCNLMEAPRNLATPQSHSRVRLYSNGSQLADNGMSHGGPTEIRALTFRVGVSLHVRLITFVFKRE